MVRTLLVRGLLAGLLAGLAAGGFAFVFGEPHIDAAIALEEAASAPQSGDGHGPAAGSGHGSAAGGSGHEHGGAAGSGHDGAAAGHEHTAAGSGHEHGEEAVVGRDGQRAGLFLATALYGLSIGGVFALVFAGLRGRVGPRDDGRLALASAGTAFAAVILVPFVKYPANPPAVGDPETITSRTVLYLVMILVGLAAVGLAVATARTVTAGSWERGIAGVVAFLVPVVAAWLLLPAVNEVPEGFPAALLWEFRMTSLGTQLVFWAVFGTGFGMLCERAARRRTRVAPAAAATTA